MKLTQPQRVFLALLRMPHGSRHVSPSYKPAARLIELGLAKRNRHNAVEITEAGREWTQ
mgnify:CR=1 FL=1